MNLHAVTSENAPMSLVEPAPDQAPPVSGVVLDLRESWLADVEVSPEKYEPRKITWYSKFWRAFESPWREGAMWWGTTQKPLIPAAPKKRRRRSPAGVQRTDTAVRLLYAMLAFAFAVALVLYVGTLMDIFDPHELSRILKR